MHYVYITITMLLVDPAPVISPYCHWPDLIGSAGIRYRAPGTGHPEGFVV